MKNKKKLLLVDCDGTLTSNKTFYTSEGRYLKIFSSKDSYAIKDFMRNGFMVIIITADKSGFSITQKRAEDWKVKAIYSSNKFKTILALKKKYQPVETVLVGNGPEDIIALRVVNSFYAPSDSTRNVLQKIKTSPKSYLLKSKGGEGVLEEVFSLINK